MTAAHPDATAFLRAINAAPADDAVRLIFADWLTENGEPERAEFIRVQCELARVTPTCGVCKLARTVSGWVRVAPACRKHDPIRARERELFWGCREWSGLRQPWSIGIGGEPLTEPIALFRRGFLHTARLTCAAFLGGPCDVCVGAGRRWSNGAPVGVKCSGCHGSGRTPGLAATLATHPVEQVVLTDREPHATYIEASGERCWAWWKAGNGPTASQLPPELWNVLVPPGRAYPVAWDEITVSNRPSLEAAHAALNAAAVAYLRQESNKA